MASGADRIQLMESLNISVMDGTGGDNLYLGRYGIYIPYNIMNFMLFDEDKLVSDVLRRFREKQMNIPFIESESSLSIAWEKALEEIEDTPSIIQSTFTSKKIVDDPIIEKKKNIRKILNDKGLMCTQSE
jgi:hypothetical protein